MKAKTECHKPIKTKNADELAMFVFKENDEQIVLVQVEGNFKQLLDEVFVISRVIKARVRVISRSRNLRLITLTSTLIILDITKTKSNNYCFIIHWTKKEMPQQ